MGDKYHLSYFKRQITMRILIENECNFYIRKYFETNLNKYCKLLSLRNDRYLRDGKLILISILHG